MPNIGPTELIIIGIIVVLLFGATRLPATAKGLGQALKLFKKEIRDDEDKPQAPEVTAQQHPAQLQAPVQQAPIQQVPVQPSPNQPQQDQPRSAVTPGNQG